MITPNAAILGMDARMLTNGGLGISTYAAALAKAQAMLTDHQCMIADQSCKPDHAHSSLADKLRREIGARFRHSLPLQGHESQLEARDIYRLAQAHFRHHGTLLKLTPPLSEGLVHWTLPLPLRIEGWINLYTIHDVIPLTHPHLTPMDGERHRRLLHEVINVADHIVTISDHASQEIIDNTTCIPEQITNCSIAVQPTVREEFTLPHGLMPGNYYIYAGSNEPRKNIHRLIGAHAASNSTRPLLLIGDHFDTARGHDNAICLPRQSSAALTALIADARALLFPSLAEGFGLPVVEAMSVGCAVMTSRGGALEEIAGGAALLIDPQNSDDIEQRLSEMDNDDSLIARLEAAGRERARFFSQERFAHKLEQLYSKLLSRSQDFS